MFQDEFILPSLLHLALFSACVMCICVIIWALSIYSLISCVYLLTTNASSPISTPSQGGVPVNRATGRAVLLQHQSSDGAGPAAGRHVPGQAVRRRVPGEHGGAAGHPTLPLWKHLLLLLPLWMCRGASRDHQGGRQEGGYGDGAGVLGG